MLEVLADVAYALTAQGDPNVGAVEGEDLVVCIEAHATPAAARGWLAQLRRHTDKPTSRSDISPSRITMRWDQAVTTPAMLLIWAFGLILASSGGWLSSGWLQVKLLLVVLLSAIHGFQSGRCVG